MTMTPRIIAQLLAMTLALGLIALVILASACGPSAPEGQASTPETATPTNTPTPTVTATSTPTATPVPTPRLLSAVTQTMYRLTEQAATDQAAGAAGASDSPQLPYKIRVTVNTRSAHEDDLKQYLIDNGATRVRATDSGLKADVPPLLLGSVIRHPAFRSGFTSGLYPRMYSWMDGPLTRYAAGELTALDAANDISEARFGHTLTDPEAVSQALVLGVIIVLDAPESGHAVRTYITANGGYTARKVPGETEFYADVPVPAFDGLYQQPGVTWIRDDSIYQFRPRPPEEPSSKSEASGVSSAAAEATPTPTPQGAAAHGADVWYQTGIDGSGVTVGIIDEGFYKFSTSMENGQLPIADQIHYKCRDRHTSRPVEGTGVPHEDCSKYAGKDNKHGTMVAETVHDVAPGVTLYISNLPRLAAAEWMKAHGVQIINASLGGWDGPGDGTGTPNSSNDIVNRAVATPNATEIANGAAAKGILFVNAAGNYNGYSWFKNGLSYSSGSNGYKNVQFSGSDECNDLNRTLYTNGSYRFIMRWAGSWDSASDNLYFEVGRYEFIEEEELTRFVPYIDTDETFFDQSLSDVNKPYDVIRWTPQLIANDYCVRIRVPGNANPSWVQLANDEDILMEYAPDSHSINNPADNGSPRMLAVGAARWNTTSTIEDYSGRGPTNPGASSTRVKPDIVGSTGVTGYVGPGSGTSQAAPHVAGLAALVMQEFPNYTPEQVAEYLKTNALPRSESVPAGTPTPTPGFNNTWGHGFARLPDIVTLATHISDPTKLTTHYHGTSNANYQFELQSLNDNVAAASSGGATGRAVVNPEWGLFNTYGSASSQLDIGGLTQNRSYRARGRSCDRTPYNDDNCGEWSDWSNSVYMNVLAVPNVSITTPNLNPSLGEWVTMTAVLDPGAGTVASYQWQRHKHWLPVTDPNHWTNRTSGPDANQYSVYFGNPSAAIGRTYRVIVTYTSGATAVSAPITVTWRAADSVITVDNASPLAGQSATLTAPVNPHLASLSHQWQRQSGSAWVDEGPNAGEYTVSSSSAGSRTYRVRVSHDHYGVAEDVISAPVTITWRAQPTPTPQPAASLSPSPSGVAFTANPTEWHRFTVNANTTIEVVANPSGSGRRVEIRASSGTSDLCPAEQNDDWTRSNGQSIYLAGCEAGTGTVALRSVASGRTLRTYTFTISAYTPPTLQCEPVSGVAASRTASGNVYISWTNPSGGLSVNQRKIDVRKWVAGNWTFDRYITLSDITTGTFHIGADHDAYYAYRVRSECTGGENSSWSGWETVPPFTGGASGQAGEPDPTPTPGTSAGPDADALEDQPEPPRQ